MALFLPDACRCVGLPQEQTRRPEKEAAAERGEFSRFLPTNPIASQLGQSTRMDFGKVRHHP
ncbi:hypothetical protein [Pararhizobium sp. PWRC1-1]|uniref:hypothetical protein n=1 Tax=Pararhizobium sp. PWRC1-1 TaxID=2804566 RepID=UPI003CE94F24